MKYFLSQSASKDNDQGSVSNRSIKEEIKTIYDGEYMNIKATDGWEFVEEKDCVIVLPHLINFNEIILRKENVPPFNTREPNKEHFLTVVSGTMEAGEDPTETLVRELKEETGIMLNTGFKGWTKWGEYFWNKGNNSKCHVYYLPITTSDFQKVVAKGDGSVSEDKSITVRIDLSYIESLRPSDLITEMVLSKFRDKINLD